jgi:hypothetical protein
MSAGHTEGPGEYAANLAKLRVEVERLRAELASLQSDRPAAAGVGQADRDDAGPNTFDGAERSAQLAANVSGSSVIAGAHNMSEATTTLECRELTYTLSLLNHTPYTPGTAVSGTPVALYALAQGIGIVVSAYGTPPAWGTSKAVHAFCQQGEAIVADSINGSAMYAHTTNGTCTIMADQGGSNSGSSAVVALGGVGVGVYASGARAPLQLGRSFTAGAPTTGEHESGELMVDTNADLYLCKVSGTPGTWNRIG